MDIMKLGAELLQSRLSGSNAGSDEVMNALKGLLGGADGTVDIAGLVSRFAASSDMGSILASWLGDGDNVPISGAAVKQVLGEGELSGFASQLGVDVDTAADGLADAIPQMVDKSSSGGSLLDAVGGVSGAVDLARKFFS